MDTYTAHTQSFGPVRSQLRKQRSNRFAATTSSDFTRGTRLRAYLADLHETVKLFFTR
jgi:hypothetical protein